MKATLITAGSIITVLSALFAFNWSGVIQFGSSLNFMYNHAEQLEHVLTDGHDVLKMQKKVDSLENVVKVLANRDSLIHAMELINRGKYPYDSVYLESESGHLFITTVEEHFINSHND